MKTLLILVVLFMSLGANASMINMHDHGASMNIQPVEFAVVSGNEIQFRSVIYACSHYPGFPNKIYGDVYECHTSREKLFAYTNDSKLFELDDQSLAQYLIDMDVTFDCANRSSKPPLVNYKGKNVYWFTGLLLAKVKSN